MRLPRSTNCAVKRWEKPALSRHQCHWSLRSATVQRRETPRSSKYSIVHSLASTSVPSIAIPLGISGSSISERMTRNAPPSSQAKLVRPRRTLPGSRGCEPSVLHSPTRKLSGTKAGFGMAASCPIVSIILLGSESCVESRQMRMRDECGLTDRASAAARRVVVHEDSSSLNSRRRQLQALVRPHAERGGLLPTLERDCLRKRAIYLRSVRDRRRKDEVPTSGAIDDEWYVHPSCLREE